MKIKTLLIGTCWLGLTLSAFAFTSRYSNITVAGSAFSNQWDQTISNMALIADNTWQGTEVITNNAGEFKFVANNNWDLANWGGAIPGSPFLTRVPATAYARRDFRTSNLRFSSLTPGPYRFTFNNSTLEFSIDWAGTAPLPLPSISNIAVVGDFNAWSPAASHMLTNHPSNTNLWSASLVLEGPTDFQFFPNGNPTNQWGAPEPTTLILPATDISVCGKSDFMLSGLYPGDFFFILNTSNATCTILQTATQELSAILVQGNFIATNTPPANMTRISDTFWESDHFITNNGTITLRFASQNNFWHWGTTNGAPSSSLPASGTLTETATNYTQVSGLTTGRYLICFNDQTGDYTFKQSYPEASGINLLLNPGFEQTSTQDGVALNWGSLQAWPKRVADGYAPHSGNWCGAVLGQLFPDWTDYAYFSQDVEVIAGTNYRASAWVKATPDWTATTMQIMMEWFDSAHSNLGSSSIIDIPALPNYWVKHSVKGIAPVGAVTSHVVFLCTGAGTSGTMQIDDVEMRAVRPTYPEMHITNIVTDADSWQFQATGNDTLDPVSDFLVFSTTNLLIPTNQWRTNSYTVTPIDPTGGNVFTLPIVSSNGPRLFYRIDPRP